jgi:hypothetical protein
MQVRLVPVEVWVEMPKKLVQNGDARRAEIIDRTGFLLHD